MVVVYGIAVLAGGLALVVWLVADASADAPGSRRRGPAERFGELGTQVVSGVLGFGLGGMSASFAGWHAALAFAAALGGSAALVAGSRLLADDRS